MPLTTTLGGFHSTHLSDSLLRQSACPLLRILCFATNRVGWPEKGCTQSGQLQSIQNGSHHRRNSTIDTRNRFIITSLLLYAFLRYFVIPIPDTR